MEFPENCKPQHAVGLLLFWGMVGNGRKPRWNLTLMQISSSCALWEHLESEVLESPMSGAAASRNVKISWIIISRWNVSVDTQYAFINRRRSGTNTTQYCFSTPCRSFAKVKESRGIKFLWKLSCLLRKLLLDNSQQRGRVFFRNRSSSYPALQRVNTKKCPQK